MPFFVTLQWFSDAELDCVQTPDWDPKSQELASISDPCLLVGHFTHCPLLRPTTDAILSRLSCCFSATLFRSTTHPLLLLRPCTEPLLLDQARSNRLSKKEKEAVVRHPVKFEFQINNK